ncbi:MAG: hypothetical protein JSS65_13690 [Armatimonadetes bacterium]|nr:hypothetical protein [Armatimonadota bacterium]
MKLPPAIDAAMWELAETGDQAALDAFVSRYPEYQAEMAQRVRMVHGLKNLKPSAKAQGRFVPVSDPLPMPTQNRWALPVAATLVLGSLVFATVSFTRWLDSQHKPEIPIVQENPPLKVKPQPIDQREPDDPRVKKELTAGGNGQAQQPEAPKTPWDVPVTLVSDRANLAATLRELALQAGVTLDIAPGMPEVDIQVDYRNQPAMLVLKDMGKNFGFSVLIQTQNTALVVPAVDPRAPAPESISGKSAVAQNVPAEDGKTP